MLTLSLTMSISIGTVYLRTVITITATNTAIIISKTIMMMVALNDSAFPPDE